MRGSIIKRNEGSYRIAVSLGKDPSTGKYKQHFETVHGSKNDAEKRLREILTSLNSGIFVKPGKTTFAEFLEKWLTDYAWPNLAPTTAEGYEHIIKRHIIPSLGNIVLNQLKPEQLQHYCSDKLLRGRTDGKGGLSTKTVRHHYITIHDALQSAVKWGQLVRNPADAVTPPRTQRREIHTLNEDDIHKFLNAAKETPYYALFYTALYTGMRRSELLALKWSDIDLLLCQMHVTKSLHHLRSGDTVIRQPKTATSKRMIILPPSAAMVLCDYRDDQVEKMKDTDSILKDDDLVFSQYDGKPLLPNTVTHYWTKLARRTGLKGIRLHDARHTHASLLLKQGVHPKVVQERLGHSSIQVTLDTYSHVTPGLQQSAALQFDKGLALNHQESLV